ELLLAFYECLTSLTILDPTCGSGAFLLAALTLLEPLYEACLARMQSMFQEVRSGADSAILERFRAILCEAQQYPTRQYFIDQSIIACNLYGVDIMEEATASCQQQFLLKLLTASQPEGACASRPVFECHIRTGNALVGYATLDELPKGLAERNQEG